MKKFVARPVIKLQLAQAPRPVVMATTKSTKARVLAGGWCRDGCNTYNGKRSSDHFRKQVDQLAVGQQRLRTQLLHLRDAIAGQQRGLQRTHIVDREPAGCDISNRSPAAAKLPAAATAVNTLMPFKTRSSNRLIDTIPALIKCY